MTWILALECDRHGNVKNGSEEKLISALSNGATLKICVVGGQDGDHLHVMSPSSIIIKNGNVYAQTIHISGAFKPDDTTIIDFSEPLVMITENICTSGRIVSAYSSEDQSGKKSFWKEVTSVALRWFVD